MATALRNAGRGGFAGTMIRDSKERVGEDSVSNPASKNIPGVIAESKHVSINYARLEQFAEKCSKEALGLPKWDAPVFLCGDEKQAARFLLLGNTINFHFTDMATRERYAYEYKGIMFEGAFGMWAALKSAIDQGKLMLNGECLANLTLEEAKKIFEKNRPMPKLEERVRILNEVGKKLVTKYGGDFYNVIEEAQGRIFNEGNGLVEILTREFPSFDDKAMYNGREVKFNKRAQLAAFMIEEKLESMGTLLFPKKDLRALTVAADYELPMVLNTEGILVFDEELDRKIKNGVPIISRSAEEVEMRAGTIFVSTLIEKKINEKRGGQDTVDARHVDFVLWNTGRQRKSSQSMHPFVDTIAY